MFACGATPRSLALPLRAEPQLIDLSLRRQVQLCLFERRAPSIYAFGGVLAVVVFVYQLQGIGVAWSGSLSAPISAEPRHTSPIITKRLFPIAFPFLGKNGERLCKTFASSRQARPSGPYLE